MTKLIISNQRTEEMVGDLQILSPEYREYLGNQAQRMAWSMQEGDVIVLPVLPGGRFLDYVTDLLRIDRGAIKVVVPPTGRYGAGILSRDRLMNEDLLLQLKHLVASHGIREIFPFHFDSTIAAMAKGLGLDAMTPGFGFLDQGVASCSTARPPFARSRPVPVSLSQRAGCVPRRTGRRNSSGENSCRRVGLPSSSRTSMSPDSATRSSARCRESSRWELSGRWLRPTVRS